VVHQLFNKRKAQHDLINGKMKEKRKLKNNTLVEQNCSRVVVAGVQHQTEENAIT